MVVKRHSTHRTRQKTRARNTRALRIVRVRFCDVLYPVHWNILCPCAFSSYFSTWNDESKHKLLQELLKIVDGFDVSPYDDEKTEVILDFKNLYLIYIK